MTKSEEQKIDNLFAFVVDKRMELEDFLDARPWEMNDAARKALDSFEQIENELRDI